MAAVFVGAVSNLGSVLDFSDMMILGMAFPNVLGLYFLLGEVRSDLTAYWQKYKSGEFVPEKGPSASTWRELAGGLKLRAARKTWIRNHVPDVLHPGQEQNHPLQPQAESGMRHRAVSPQVDIHQ